MKNTTAIIIAILLMLCFYLGNERIKERVFNTELSNMNDSLWFENDKNLHYITVQSDIISKLNNQKDTCKTCSRYPIYETRD